MTIEKQGIFTPSRCIAIISPKPQCTDALNPVNNPENLFQWLFLGLLCQPLDKYLDASLWTMSPPTSVSCLPLGSRTRFYYQKKLKRSAGQRKAVGSIVTETYILIKRTWITALVLYFCFPLNQSVKNNLSLHKFWNIWGQGKSEVSMMRSMVQALGANFISKSVIKIANAFKFIQIFSYFAIWIPSMRPTLLCLPK